MTTKEEAIELKREAMGYYGMLKENNTFECLECHQVFPFCCARLSHTLNNGTLHRYLCTKKLGYTRYDEEDYLKNKRSLPAGVVFLTILKRLNWPIEEKYPMKYICANCHAIVEDREDGHITAKENAKARYFECTPDINTSI